MSLESNIQYMEGQWAGKSMLKHIDSTIYKTLEKAIEVKTALITDFEKHFGFSKEMEELDSNYAFELGLLNTLLKEKENG